MTRERYEQYADAFEECFRAGVSQERYEEVMEVFNAFLDWIHMGDIGAFSNYIEVGIDANEDIDWRGIDMLTSIDKNIKRRGYPTHKEVKAILCTIEGNWYRSGGRDKPGFVYIAMGKDIQIEGDIPFKIGYTKNVEKRRSALKSQGLIPFEITMVWESEHAYKVETQIKRILPKYFKMKKNEYFFIEKSKVNSVYPKVCHTIQEIINTTGEMDGATEKADG
jgi:hypothetical protein